MLGTGLQLMSLSRVVVVGVVVVEGIWYALQAVVVDLFVAALLLQSLSMRMGRASLKASCSPAERRGSCVMTK